MSFTYGFYNSVNGDRRYNAEQMAAVFDCLINDGVQENIGSAMVVTPATGDHQVAVGTGRAWFNSTWSYNDAAYPLTLNAVTAQGYSRIDAICLVVDKRTESRANRYEVVRGVAGNAPTKPALPTTDQVFYHVLAYVTVDYGVTAIPTTKIENRVGTSDCPFITGILQTIDISTLLDQWHGQFDEWFEEVQSELTDDVAGALLNKINHLQIKETTMNKYGFSNNPEDSRYQEYPVDAVVNQIYILLSPLTSDVSTLKANSGKIKYNGSYSNAKVKPFVILGKGLGEHYSYTSGSSSYSRGVQYTLSGITPNRQYAYVEYVKKESSGNRSYVSCVEISTGNILVVGNNSNAFSVVALDDNYVCIAAYVSNLYHIYVYSINSNTRITDYTLPSNVYPFNHNGRLSKVGYYTNTNHLAFVCYQSSTLYFYAFDASTRSIMQRTSTSTSYTPYAILWLNNKLYMYSNGYTYMIIYDYQANSLTNINLNINLNQPVVRYDSIHACTVILNTGNVPANIILHKLSNNTAVSIRLQQQATSIYPGDNANEFVCPLFHAALHITVVSNSNAVCDYIDSAIAIDETSANLSFGYIRDSYNVFGVSEKNYGYQTLFINETDYPYYVTNGNAVIICGGIAAVDSNGYMVCAIDVWQLVCI